LSHPSDPLDPAHPSNPLDSAAPPHPPNPPTMSIAALLGPDAPSNWGRWGPEDEVGSLNYLTSDQVLKGLAEVVSGQVRTLQIPIGADDVEADPVYPGRAQAVRTALRDEGFWRRGEVPETADGHHWADDAIAMPLQGTTQYDALGHVWYDGRLWNGYDAMTTDGRLRKCSVAAIAERGVVGRGVLIDLARSRGKPWLERGEVFDHRDLLEAAARQGLEIERRDILLIRTGWLEYYRTVPNQVFYDDFLEPGLTYSRALVEWFQDMEIPNLVTDTIAVETTFEPATGVQLPLHSALMRNLGVALTEMCWLKDLAELCQAQGRWSFLYLAAPLKVVGASGSPVNPVVVL
jgi:kynurenine formamidase